MHLLLSMNLIWKTLVLSAWREYDLMNIPYLANYSFVILQCFHNRTLIFSTGVDTSKNRVGLYDPFMCLILPRWKQLVCPKKLKHKQIIN